jgi:hypothetical protein
LIERRTDGEVAERRPIIAHGETVGLIVKRKFKPRQGRQKINERFCLSPLPGLGWFRVFNSRLTSWATLYRASGAPEKIKLDAVKMEV